MAKGGARQRPLRLCLRLGRFQPVLRLGGHLGQPGFHRGAFTALRIDLGLERSNLPFKGLKRRRRYTVAGYRLPFQRGQPILKRAGPRFQSLQRGGRILARCL